MDEFIKGALVESVDGATYEGVVYDRWLRVRVSREVVLEVFDPAEPISHVLKEHETYLLVLVAAIPESVKSFASHPPRAATGTWQAVIVNPHWRPSKGEYRYARSRLFEQEWVLLETPSGRLLMSPGDIGETVNQGGIVQWGEARLDLYAVS